MEKQKKSSKVKGEARQETALELAVRKQDLDRVRGKRKVLDPERGPENKK
jgi:hypothetical protein